MLPRKSSITIILFACLAFLQAACEPEYEVRVSEKESYYTFSPETILNDITQGKIDDIFALISPETVDKEEHPVYWTSADYFSVAWLLKEQISQDSLDSWQLRAVSLNYECANPDLGFSRGVFDFFRTGNTGDQQFRDTLGIDVKPGSKVARRYDIRYSPVLEKWKAINLDELQVSAEQAVEIARRNGGDAVVAFVEDRCFAIASLLQGGSGYQGWTVRYNIFNEKSSLETIFEIHIHPVDGRFQVVVP